MVEQWKEVSGASRYLVSTHGRVFDTKRLKYVATNINGGRERSVLANIWYDDGKRRTPKVHRLVADAFIPNPHNKPTVNHIDGCRQNNLLSNLEWATHSENHKHAYQIGLKNAQGSNNGRSILNEDDVLEIKKRMEQGESQVSLARYYGVSTQTIQNIKSGKNWSHITLGGQAV